ncbi:MAG: hypothetical protein HYY76_15530 [Acidobacteria bacterium]|nr:hypothetical protein [Acidobacteriota bacterium]
MALTLTAVENRPAIAVVWGSDVSPARYPEILAILSQNWRNADPYLDDFSTVMRNSAGDMLVRISDGWIDGVLRTKLIRSQGNPLRVHGSFEELVGPYWSRRDRVADTRILVDLTKREGASGVARSLIAACLDAFREPNIATFSPEDRAALHTHFGAYPVGRIENARPRHPSPHVILMCYRGFSRHPWPRLSPDLAA